MTRLPCPPWCAADHDQGDVNDDLRLHTSIEIRVPVLATEGVESTEHAASVCAAVVDSLTTGIRHPVAVLVSGAAERELSPGNALRLADALRITVTLTEGLRVQGGGCTVTTLDRPWGAVRVEALPGLVGYAFITCSGEELAGDLLPEQARVFANAAGLFDELMPGIMGPDMAAAMVEAADQAEALADGDQEGTGAPPGRQSGATGDALEVNVTTAIAILRAALTAGTTDQRPGDTG